MEYNEAAKVIQNQVRKKRYHPCDPTDEIGDQLIVEYKEVLEKAEEAKKKLWIHQTNRAMNECEDTYLTHMGIIYEFVKIMDDSTEEYISKENIKRLHKLSAMTDIEVE